MSKTKSNDSEPKKGVLRSNIEAFTVAIAVALAIKQFAFEAFRVPTESMEPAIIGRESFGDQLIVNKFTYMVRDPKRWEVVVFRYPLSRLVNYVKRLVGEPGETVWILRGDIYTAPKESDDLRDFKIQRKPHNVQESVFARHPAFAEEDEANFDRGAFNGWWNVPSGAEGLKDGLAVSAGDEPVMVETWATREVTDPESGETWNRVTISSERRDWMAPTRMSTQDAQLPPSQRPVGLDGSEHRVGDVRLRVEVTPKEGTASVLLRIEDGTQFNRPIVLEIPVGNSGTARLTHGEDAYGDPAFAGLHLPAGKETKLTLDNVDDCIRVWRDGDLIAEKPYEHRGGDLLAWTQVAFGARKGRAEFRKVRVFNDLHYRPGPDKERFQVPDGHYFFIGDNPPNSLDGRGWRVVGIRLRASGRILLGDMEAVSDDLWAPRQAFNPWLVQGKQEHHFIDLDGNRHLLERGSYDILDLKWFPESGAGASGRDLGTSKVLELHRTICSEADLDKIREDWKEQGHKAEVADPIEYEAVDKMRLQDITIQAKSGGERWRIHSFCPLMHFVSRKEIVGRANMVFFPFTRIGSLR